MLCLMNMGHDIIICACLQPWAATSISISSSLQQPMQPGKARKVPGQVPHRLWNSHMWRVNSLQLALGITTTHELLRMPDFML
jgi:hypothetical protein